VVQGGFISGDVNANDVKNEAQFMNVRNGATVADFQSLLDIDVYNMYGLLSNPTLFRVLS
jgi:hypothetical protein